MKNQVKWKRKILLIVMMLSLTISLVTVLTNALVYQVSYKKVYFETVETITTYTKPAQIENLEPVVNFTLNDDGSKKYFVFCSDTLATSDGGHIKRENQVSVLHMKISAQIYSWSYMNLYSFEDMTKGEEKLKKKLELIASRSGLTNSLPHLEKYR